MIREFVVRIVFCVITSGVRDLAVIILFNLFRSPLHAANFTLRFHAFIPPPPLSALHHPQCSESRRKAKKITSTDVVSSPSVRELFDQFHHAKHPTNAPCDRMWPTFSLKIFSYIDAFPF